jgi:hypothetical protein
MPHDEHAKYIRDMYPPRREVASENFHRAKWPEREIGDMSPPSVQSTADRQLVT